MFLASGDRSTVLLVIAEGRRAARLLELCFPTRAAHVSWRFLLRGDKSGAVWRQCGVLIVEQHRAELPRQYLVVERADGRRDGWHSTAWINRSCGTSQDLTSLKGLLLLRRPSDHADFGRKHCPLSPVESGPLAKAEKPKPAQEAWPRATFPAQGLDHGAGEG